MSIQRTDRRRTAGLGLAVALAVLLLLTLAVTSGTPTVHAQAGTGIIRVATTGNDAPGCGSQANPCRTVQYAVDQALSGEEIRVAEGTYSGVSTRPAPAGYEGPAVITQVVYLDKSLTIRGGYPPGSWDVPDPEAHPSTLDAEGQGRVLVIAGAINPTLEGLRVTGGDAKDLGGGWFAWDAGGGVFVYTATATIRHCVIYSNTATTNPWHGASFGGGLYLVGSDAVLSDNTISNNLGSSTDEGYGGGLYLYLSPATVSNNTIVGNTGSIRGGGAGGGLFLKQSDALISANQVISNTGSTIFWGHGGGIYLQNSRATVSSNTVQGNIGTTTFGYGYGGGIRLDHSSDTLAGNKIIGNTASKGHGAGGGLCIEYGAPTLTGNMIISNTVAPGSSWIEGHGGGLCIKTTPAVTLTNNLVADNYSPDQGSGLWLDGYSYAPTAGRLRHNTIADNYGCSTGVYVAGDTTLVMTNTIVAGHESLAIEAAFPQTTVTLEGTLWYNNMTNTGGPGTILLGTVNVYDSPAFANPGAWDYHLTAGSAAIDQGVDAGVTTDIDGQLRPNPDTGLPDLGADEYWPALGLLVGNTAEDLNGSPLRMGDLIRYDITVTNQPTSVLMSNVRVTDTLPAGVAFLSAEPAGYTGPNPLRWGAGDLAPGDVWTSTILVEVDGSADPIGGNVVEVSSDLQGPVSPGPVWPPDGGDVVPFAIYLPLVVRDQ
jgi:uncharacterized repeat protein (TIGR01451 family)